MVLPRFDRNSLGLMVDLAFSKGGLRYSYIMQGSYMHMYMSHRLTLSTERRIQSFTFRSMDRGSPPYLTAYPIVLRTEYSE